MVTVATVMRGAGPSESLCRLFVSEFAVAAASVSVVGTGNRQLTVCASNALAAEVDALQFELGEGPRWEALASRAPVLCPDLHAAVPSHWPIFHEAATALGVRAVFAVPMVMGAALVGVVDLYDTSPRVLEESFAGRASLLAGQVSSAAVQRALASAEANQSAETALSPALRREVHQATGMLISQLDVSATEAFSRLQAHAFATGRPLHEIAHEVVQRILDFTEPSE
jgi:GAF domain-containing protein